MATAANSIGEAFVVIRPDTKGFAAQADKDITGALSPVFSKIATLAKAAAIAGGVALAGLGAWGLKSAADMQQVEIAFEGIFQSGTKSAAFLDELRAFAAKTPFEFPELARAAKLLLATGFAAEDVIPIMTKLGNVAATLGVGGAEIEGVVRALGQMKGKGKASAEELQQISEQIPGFSAIGAIADSMGITVAEAFDKMKDGAITADDAIEAILVGMDKFPGAAGAMERQSKTLNGVLSTLKDTLQQGLVQGIAPVLPALAGAVNAAIPAITEVVTIIGATFGDLLTKVMPLLAPLISLFGTLADIVGSVLGKAFEILAPVLDTLVAAIGPLVTAFAKALMPVLEALGPILSNIAVYVGLFFKKLADSGVLEKFGRAIGKVLEAAAPLIPILGDALLKVLDALMPLFPILAKAMEKLAPVVGKIIKAFEPFIDRFAEGLVQIIEGLLPVLPQLIDSFLRIFDALLPLMPLFLEFMTLGLRLVPILTPVVAFLAEVLAGAIEGIAIAVEWVRDHAGPAWEEIKKAAEAAYRFLDDYVIKPIVTALNWMKDRFDEVWGVIGPIIEEGVKLGLAALGPFFDALDRLIGLAKDVKEVFSDLFGGVDAETRKRIDDYERFVKASGVLANTGTFVAPGPYEGYDPARGYASGGWVGGSGNRDSVAAMLTPGEFVVTKDGSNLDQIAGGDRYDITIHNLSRSDITNSAVELVKRHRLAQALR